MILLAGEDSYLASTLLPVLRNEYQVCSFSTKKGDMCDTRFMNDLFDEIQPEICINCEDVHDYIEAEIYRERAYAKNSFAAGCLAEICRRKNVPLVHLSTTAFYKQDTDEPKGEDSPVQPLSVYADSKLLGEQKILESGCAYCIFRVTEIFGRNNTLLSQAYADAKEGKRITLIRDSMMMPVSSFDVSQYILQAVQNKLTGIFNVAGNEKLSRYQFYYRFFDLFNEISPQKLNPDVVEVDYDRYLYPVDLPRHNCADTTRIHTETGNCTQQLDDSLRSIIQEFVNLFSGMSHGLRTLFGVKQMSGCPDIFSGMNQIRNFCHRKLFLR